MLAKGFLISRIDELASDSDGKQAKKQKFSSISFYDSCPQKEQYRFKAGLPTLKDPGKKIPHRHSQLLHLI